MGKDYRAVIIPLPLLNLTERKERDLQIGKTKPRERRVERQIKSRILMVASFLTPAHVFLSAWHFQKRMKNEELLAVQGCDVVFHLPKYVSSFLSFFSNSGRQRQTVQANSLIVQWNLVGL